MSTTNQELFQPVKESRTLTADEALYREFGRAYHDHLLAHPGMIASANQAGVRAVRDAVIDHAVAVGLVVRVGCKQ